jgi:hypothetical protein
MKKKTVKEFFEGAMNVHPIGSIQLASKLVELEAIDNWLRLMYGVELETYIVPAEVQEGRWYGKGFADKLKKED